MRIPYASLEAFKAKAKLLESLLKLKGRRRTLEVLSRLSGYASYHEVSHIDLTPGQLPTVDQVAAQLLNTFPKLSSEEVLRVAEAIGLHIERKQGKSAQATAEKKFTALYVTKTPVDRTALHEFEFLKHRRGGLLQPPPFDPCEQAQELQSYRRPEFYLRSQGSGPDHPDLPQVTSGYYDVHQDYTPSNGELSEWWYDYILDELYPKYVKQPGPVDLSDDERDCLWDFWLHPTSSVAENHRVLSRIPDVVRLAEFWKPYHLSAYAQLSAAESSNYTVLVGETPAPAGATWAHTGSQICCSIAFKESQGVELDVDDNMSIWEYSVCFMLTSKGGKQAKPIALMAGTHITPFRMHSGYEFQAVGPGYFADFMDAHSAMLNDVWKVLNYQYFVDQGYENVTDFAWERMEEAFTVASLEIAPEFRGKGLTPALLNLFITTVARYPESELDAGWARACSLQDDDEEDAPSLNLGTPGVLILPVEGSEPSQKIITPADILLSQSPRKVKVVNKDPVIELRKVKLTAHFQAMQEQVEADIVVYDPWEYPMT